MTGEELYLKAQNGGKGFPAWGKLPAGHKGLWNNAVRELEYEKCLLLGRGRRAEQKRIACYLRNDRRLFDVADSVERGSYML